LSVLSCWPECKTGCAIVLPNNCWEDESAIRIATGQIQAATCSLSVLRHLPASLPWTKRADVDRSALNCEHIHLTARTGLTKSSCGAPQFQDVVKHDDLPRRPVTLSLWLLAVSLNRVYSGSSPILSFLNLAEQCEQQQLARTLIPSQQVRAETHTEKSQTW
jgi:hypothetical protein